jgi:hypothetical protein
MRSAILAIAAALTLTIGELQAASPKAPPQQKDDGKAAQEAKHVGMRRPLTLLSPLDVPPQDWMRPTRPWGPR